MRSYVCGIDISSSKIAAAVAELRGRSVANIFLETAPSKGIKKGVIVDAASLVNAVGSVLKALRQKSGIRIRTVYANISGSDIVVRRSRAIVPLAERGNKIITLSDVQKADEQARILGSNLEEEIIHAIPFSYSIDSREEIINPLGLYSHRLEADLYLICGRLSAVQSLTRVIQQAGYEIKDFFFSGIATSKAVFGPEASGGRRVFCDIGSDITEMLVFGEGMLKDVSVLAAGGDTLTSGLCESLHIPFELAEEVKRTYASVGACSSISEDKEILIKKEELYRPIKQREVCEVLTLHARGISARIKEALSGIVPLERIDSLTAVGRTALLDGFLEMLETDLGVPVRLGRVADPRILPAVNKDAALAGQKYLTYLTALGLISQALSGGPSWTLAPASTLQMTRNPIMRVVNRFKEIYQEYF